MNAFLHKLAGLARTIPPFHESHAAWRAPSGVTKKSTNAADGCGARHADTSRKWTIAGLR
ncbi:MAG TPA: hypothetical protein VJL61_13070 [Rhodanobacteraceae bacterium]|nr:hypothetical protein [Rhodanobacteraceae bacterium]